MKRILIGLLILNLSWRSSSQEMSKDSLDAFFKVLENNGLANGSIAIAKAGRIVYQKQVGFALKGKEGQVGTSPESKYRIGSVTKMFTAAVVFQLVEEKELQLESRLSEFIPGVRDGNNITVEMLLSHRSGLVNYTEGAAFNNRKHKIIPVQELLKFISETTLKFAPGSKQDYSNINYLLLSCIIEKIGNKPYQEVVAERIFAKEGLKNTYFKNAPDSGLKNSKSYKYTNQERLQQPETVASNHLGAGAVVSTPADLLRFTDALFSYIIVNPAFCRQNDHIC